MTNVPLNVMIGVNLVPNEDDYLRSGIVERDSTISFNFPAEELAKFGKLNFQFTRVQTLTFLFANISRVPRR